MTSVSVLGSSQVTVQFDLDRNIDAAAGDVQAAINAAGGQLPKNLPNPPTYRKVNPADSPILILSVQSDTLPLIEVDDWADNILSQQISQIAGVARCRSAASRSAPCGSRWTRQAGRHGHDAGGRAHHAGQRHRQQRQGQHRRAAPVARDLRQRPADQGSRVQRRHPGLPQRRARAGARHRPAVDGPENARLAGWQNGQPRHPAADLQAARRQRHRHRGPDPRRTAEPAGGDPALGPGRHHHRPHADHPGLGEGRAVHPAAVDRPGGDGDLPVPAQRLGDHHPERHGAARAGRHLRGDVPARLQPGQPVADGADHRRRLRRGRRHRHAREHLPLRRGGHEPDGRRPARRRGDRVHHHLHQRLADRGVHPAAADGRHRRPAVPRVRHDGGHRRGGVGRSSR